MKLPKLLSKLFKNELVLRPVPPDDHGRFEHLTLPVECISIDVEPREWPRLIELVNGGSLKLGEVKSALTSAGLPDDYMGITSQIDETPDADWDSLIEENSALDQLGLLAIRIIDRLQNRLLKEQPLTQFQFELTNQAKAVLAVGWEAISKRGSFPLPPRGRKRIAAVREEKPTGTMHFVSASDLDAGYFFTMGIALSPEAQAQNTTCVSFGLDGELIVPGQAVSPIPPYLAMATRLFAASIPTSSNISEEEQSIPIRDFPSPSGNRDHTPRRSGRVSVPSRPFDTDAILTDLKLQLCKRRADKDAMPMVPVAAVYDVTGLNQFEIQRNLSEVVVEESIARSISRVALLLNLQGVKKDRVGAIMEAVDGAERVGISHVAVADDTEDAWLANLLEYLEPGELNALADYADTKGVVVIDGRPIDPVYTAATAAQRIQSVFTTLAVDVLKMGMWLCLDAMAARRVWAEICAHPHIPSRMLLMPIGIVEPWNGFVDNREPGKTPRAIIDPFAKIKFMIEEATQLGIPSLLTDTRHKEKWVLLGRKTPTDEPHPREKFVRDPLTQEVLGRTEDSAIPLLNWGEFMECERLARKAGIFLGQAGSVESDQLFAIISDTTYDAAKDHKNPATAIWTAETERVLKTQTGATVGLHSQRSADVSPFLAVINRGFESHAKLDGWVRYLSDCGDGGFATLATELSNHRSSVKNLIDQIVQDAGQGTWEQLRLAYIAYHELVKSSFVNVQLAVQEQWANG